MSRPTAPRLLPVLVAALGALLEAGAPPTLSAQQLTVALEPETVTVGDRVTATLTLTAPQGAVAGDPRFPEWGDSWGEAEVLETGPVERIARRPAAPRDQSPNELPNDRDTVVWRQRLVLATFRTGEVPLPPRAVTLPLGADPGAGRSEGPAKLRTPPDLALTVESVLPADTDPAEAELAPAAPPRPLPVGSRFWWALATAALVAAATVATAVARRPRASSGPSRRATPLEELLESLRLLSTEPSPGPGHEGLSLTLRRYLGRSLDFAAVESTTTEVKHHLRWQSVPPELVARTHEVLQACDRVKFACEPSDHPVFVERLDAVREIARELDCRLHRCAEPEAPNPLRNDLERP